MIDQDVFKAVIHDDDAFKDVLESIPEKALETLREMHLRVSTQIIKYGDERPEWYRKANLFSILLKRRISETEAYLYDTTGDWKEFAIDLVTKLYEAGYGAEEMPETNGLDEISEWAKSIKLTE